MPTQTVGGSVPARDGARSLAWESFLGAQLRFRILKDLTSVPMLRDFWWRPSPFRPPSLPVPRLFLSSRHVLRQLGASRLREKSFSSVRKGSGNLFDPLLLLCLSLPFLPVSRGTRRGFSEPLLPTRLTRAPSPGCCLRSLATRRAREVYWAGREASHGQRRKRTYGHGPEGREQE